MHLGNCYLMSSLAALSNIPQLCCQLFRKTEIDENGYYEKVFLSTSNYLYWSYQCS